jgi:catechol 2,3-dioxygenase-like lactoylglutathione lyase family enzyme
VRFVRVTLRASATRIATLADFYGRQLGFPITSSDDGLAIVAGETTLEFAGDADEPFYHFALLVPGNRFDAALAWARAKTQLLLDSESGEVVFDFDAWNAEACYFHDPAGNIVELIAHRGVDETKAGGEFRATELAGFSELGLVGDPRAMADSLARRLGLELWDGTVDVPGRLAFVGERARTLILAPPDRGWLPTGRAAERHDLEVVLSGPKEGETELEASRYRIRASPR